MLMLGHGLMASGSNWMSLVCIKILDGKRTWNVVCDYRSQPNPAALAYHERHYDRLVRRHLHNMTPIMRRAVPSILAPMGVWESSSKQGGNCCWSWSQGGCIISYHQICHSTMPVPQESLAVSAEHVLDLQTSQGCSCHFNAGLVCGAPCSFKDTCDTLDHVPCGTSVWRGVASQTYTSLKVRTANSVSSTTLPESHVWQHFCRQSQLGWEHGFYTNYDIVRTTTRFPRRETIATAIVASSVHHSEASILAAQTSLRWTTVSSTRK